MISVTLSGGANSTGNMFVDEVGTNAPSAAPSAAPVGSISGSVKEDTDNN
eukprot:CAMPEP_0119027508 /NCGR_PEP_ID=MMETSP1176-20130426/37200_1 /TAXON_ID=265551 /ORGANISM="Synedropsis recta cf, Strain CCMP1620" /LENGTH=49 /DNA_ID= /DNA_START= /DNA_END= /DNA_ORIENTATION=